MNNKSLLVRNIILVGGLTCITLVSTFALDLVKTYKRSVEIAEATENRIIGERAIVEAFMKIPVKDLLEYKELKILKRINEEDFEVLSVTKANLYNADILWKDYAEFKDKNGDLIARTSPCLTKPTDDVFLKEFCIGQSYKFWFQFQFWQKKNITRQDGRSEKWTFKQRLIPPEAVEIIICSDQVITVHKNKEYGNVDRVQHVCSEPFDLRGINK